MVLESLPTFGNHLGDFERVNVEKYTLATWSIQPLMTGDEPLGNTTKNRPQMLGHQAKIWSLQGTTICCLHDLPKSAGIRNSKQKGMEMGRQYVFVFFALEILGR